MKHIIFDFDGTLVDSLPVVVKIAQTMVPNLDLSPKTQTVLREMPARELIKHSGIPYWRIPSLLIRGKKMLAKHLPELKTFTGINEVIKQLHQDGIKMSVVSSNSEENIRKILRREAIEQYFSGVYGNVGLFSKTRAFKVVLRDQKTRISQAIYVGDEVRDIESAKKAGLPIIAVTWGYNGQKVLEKYQPDYLVKAPQELLKVIESVA